MNRPLWRSGHRCRLHAGRAGYDLRVRAKKAPSAADSRQAARPEKQRSPLLAVAGAAAAGLALARVIDWRSHAHPR
jgi:hypothetical protein